MIGSERDTAAVPTSNLHRSAGDECKAARGEQRNQGKDANGCDDDEGDFRVFGFRVAASDVTEFIGGISLHREHQRDDGEQATQEQELKHAQHDEGGCALCGSTLGCIVLLLRHLSLGRIVLLLGLHLALLRVLLWGLHLTLLRELLLGLLILRDVLLWGLLLRVLWLIIVLVCHSRHLSSLLRRRYVSSNNDEGRILCEVKDSITHRRLHFMKEALKRKSNCTIGYTSHDGL